MKALIFLSLFCATAAFAGGSTGGGTVTKKHGKPMLLDLAEEGEDPKAGLVEFDPRKLSWYGPEFIRRIDAIAGRMPGSKELMVNSIGLALANTKFYFSDKPLASTSDTCLTVKDPDLSQAAVQKAGEVVIYRPWFESSDVDDENRSALLFHELAMQVKERPACSSEIRAATRAFIHQDKRSVDQLGQQLFVKGLGFPESRVYSEEGEKSLKHVLFNGYESKYRAYGGLNGSLAGFCAHTFDFSQLHGGYADKEADTALSFRISFEDFVQWARDPDYHAPVSEVLTAPLQPRMEVFIDLLRSGKSNAKGWEKCGTSGAKEACVAAARKIQAEECKLYNTWKASDRPFHELAREIRTDVKPDFRAKVADEPATEGTAPAEAGEGSAQ